VVQSEIPERILLKYTLKAKTQSEVHNNAYLTEVEEDVKIAADFIYNRMRDL